VAVGTDLPACNADPEVDVTASFTAVAVTSDFHWVDAYY